MANQKAGGHPGVSDRAREPVPESVRVRNRTCVMVRDPIALEEIKQIPNLPVDVSKHLSFRVVSQGTAARGLEHRPE